MTLTSVQFRARSAWQPRLVELDGTTRPPRAVLSRNSTKRVPTENRGSTTFPDAKSCSVEDGTEDAFASARRLPNAVTRSAISFGQNFISTSVRKSGRISQAFPDSPITVHRSERHSGRDLTENWDMSRTKPQPRDPEEERRLRQPGVKAGVRVRYWRERRGLSIRALAKKAGIAHGTLGDLERGDTTTGMQLQKLAKVLEISDEYLLSGKGEPEGRASGAAELMLVEPSPDQAIWPFSTIPLSRIADLNANEFRLFELELQRILEQIEHGRERAPAPDHRRRRSG